MTITELPVDRLEALETKIDLLADQMAVLTAEVEMLVPMFVVSHWSAEVSKRMTRMVFAAVK